MKETHDRMMPLRRVHGRFEASSMWLCGCNNLLLMSRCFDQPVGKGFSMMTSLKSLGRGSGPYGLR